MLLCMPHGGIEDMTKFSLLVSVVAGLGGLKESWCLAFGWVSKNNPLPPRIFPVLRDLNATLVFPLATLRTKTCAFQRQQMFLLGFYTSRVVFTRRESRASPGTQPAVTTATAPINQSAAPAAEEDDELIFVSQVPGTHVMVT